MQILEETPLKEQFDRDGYCVVPGLFTEEEIEEICAHFEIYKTNGLPVYDSGTTYEETDPSKRQLRALHPHRYSEQAKNWMIQPAVMDMLEILLGKPALAVQSMYYFKPPGAKG